jgi:ferredoxin
MTLATKIMYGVVPGLTKAIYHAQFPRKDSFADMMLDILTIIKPHLYVMDGVLGMQGQGPGSGDPVTMNLVLASTNHVAMDISVCKILGIEPVAIPALKRAKVRGLWPEKIDYPIHGPEDVAYKGFRLPNTADHLLTGRKPPRKSPIIADKCTACGDCERICPKDAVKVRGQKAEVTYTKCIRCYCCHEVCPEDAIMLGSVKLS